MEEKKFKKIRLFLTGYLGFCGISDNPTETLVKEIIKNKSEYESDSLEIVNHQIFEVSTKYVDKNIPDFYSKIKNEKDSKTLHLIVHFGLYAGITKPQIETTAQNFIRDEFQRQPICKEQGNCLLSKLPTQVLVQNMNCTKNCPNCNVSNDAGTYLCNYMFYKSLKNSQQKDNVVSTFIHIPQFTNCSLEEDLKFFGVFLDNVKKVYL